MVERLGDSGDSRRGWRCSLCSKEGGLLGGFYKERLLVCSARIFKPIATHLDSYSVQIRSDKRNG
jgi:hypothetical protein